MKSVLLLLFAAIVTVTLILPASVNAAVITPQRGGGSIGGTVAPMIMPRITFDGTNVSVLAPGTNDIWPTTLDGWTVPTGFTMPIMRTLDSTIGEELSTTAVYYDELNGKAWNWQYGWGNTALDQSKLLATGGKIWIELLNQSDGIKTYYRTSANTPFTPIFGTDGTPNIWQWPETVTMSHNAYTVAPGIADWDATYKVYIGDAVTGAALAGYGSTTAVFKWTSVPEPATLALLGTGLVCLFRKRAKA